MTIAKLPRRVSGTGARDQDLRKRLASVGRHLSEAIKGVRTGGTRLIELMPGTIDATRARAHETTSALQTLPDPTLRWLAASSVGLGAGFYLAGAPRVVIAAGVAPALILGAAIVLRPIEPAIPAEADRS
jgi:hypothetical protein